MKETTIGEIKNFFSKVDNRLLFFVAIISAINSLFLLAATFGNQEKSSILKFEYVYISYFIIAIIFAVSISFTFKKTKKILLQIIQF